MDRPDIIQAALERGMEAFERAQADPSFDPFESYGGQDEILKISYQSIEAVLLYGLSPHTLITSMIIFGIELEKLRAQAELEAAQELPV